MSSLSPTEWNAKAQVRWDLESLIMFNATTKENPKKLPKTDWGTDGDRGVDSGSLYSSVSGTGSANGGSGSDFGLASLSKSSKSASISSSSTGEVKTFIFASGVSEPVPGVLNENKEVLNVSASANSSTLEPKVGTSEPLLSLKLGKRAYFKDNLAEGNTKISSLSTIPVSSITPVKRSKSSTQSTAASHCQVEGCKIDLSSAKDYHRKHRVCESHSKCPKVIVAGIERRFCQQCSRFHGLSEFDEKKRSCRRRLSDHNARRRKPQPESVQFNSARLSTLLYDRRKQVTLDWSREPLFHTPNGILTSEGTSSSKFTIVKEYMLKSGKAEDITGQTRLLDHDLTNSIPVPCRDLNCSLPNKVKGTVAEILNQGSQESLLSLNVDATQDLHRALSLLSTKSWASWEPKSISFEQPAPTCHTVIPESLPHVSPQGLPEYWTTEHQSNDMHMHASNLHNDARIYFQEFQPVKNPYECDFYSNQLN
ncbi:hypothetical protein K2173_005822 [Erythroxylum novogranatense]|uniref:SBP-type domain-containing protein n=1 Tax=Erythroxylum novogranatense TaxID=1862640 RepID=A0AAV8U2S4_9ROSI|nr:hypothetical protein K2173_005822 [Erythroxylum novogranatense]